MRIVFMGTPDFAVPSLQALIDAGHDVCAVYTQPDKPQGRKQILTAPPVKTLALEHDIPVFQPNTLKNEDEQARLRELAPEVIIVVAYGKLLPKAVLDIPPHGCINVHGSLLPRWRGAAPIERAILAGDEQTGVCIMRMEEGLDTGPYCVRRATEVEGKSAAELTDELANLGARALLTGLSVVEQGGAEWTFQDDAAATYAEKLAKDELYPDPAEPAAAMVRKVLASSEAHPARAVIAGRSATVERVALPDDERAAALCDGLEQGAVRFAAKRLFLGTGEGAVEVLSLKPDGRKSMDARAFAAGVQGIKAGGCTWGRVDG